MFKLHSDYKPAGDQPEAIAQLVEGLNRNLKHQVLLGATGTGKTFTMANIIQTVQKPTLVLAHNKTLAAQLFSEFKKFFPENAVKYFISYYDYYQPESYIPSKDLYIEKEVEINKDIEKYRAAATQSLLTRKDVIIIASVSAIYGLGDPEDFMALTREFEVNNNYKRDNILNQLIDLQYERSEYEFEPGSFRVRGDNIDIYSVGGDNAVKLQFFGELLESIAIINPIDGVVLDRPNTIKIFPAKAYITPFEKMQEAVPRIKNELQKQLEIFTQRDKLLEAKRLEQRVNFDIEMLSEIGYVKGVENYSRIIENRQVGSSPSTLLSYFPKDWLLFIDESHITLPQVRGMYAGDRARKLNLVDYGFRLPSALDNRPLKIDEFMSKLDQVIYTSATPSDEELELAKNCGAKVVEQIIRPTGLLDPIVEIRPLANQVLDLISEIEKTINKFQRVMVTTLTKRMAEDLTTYLKEKNIKVQYIHSDVDSITRVEILQDLRLGVYDVLIGINLLREGLDLPEVSLIAILDADKEGFLRSKTSLIQTIGRAARHLEGRAILYADNITKSIKFAVDETERRRLVQHKYNLEHNITPKGIIKTIEKEALLIRESEKNEIENSFENSLEKRLESVKLMSKIQKKNFKAELEFQMELFADQLEFEKAAKLRDVIKTF